MPHKLLSAPLQSTADDAAAYSLSITANESGIVHLKDAILVTHGDAALANGALDLSSCVEITDLKLNGATLLLRGRNTPAGPNFLISRRGGNFCNLPSVRVKSGDVIQITCVYIYNGATGDAIFGAPFQPDGYRLPMAPAMGGKPEVWMASPTAAVADDGVGTLTLTFDNAGWVDLDFAILQVKIDPTLNVEASQAVWAGELADVTSFQVRTDAELVVGQNTPAGPGAFFSARRARNFLQLGRHHVASGDQIVMKAHLKCGGAMDMSWGAPFVPDGGIGGGVSSQNCA